MDLASRVSRKLNRKVMVILLIKLIKNVLLSIQIYITDNVNMSYVNNAFNGGHEMEERRADSKTTAERMGYEMYNGRAVTENR